VVDIAFPEISAKLVHRGWHAGEHVTKIGPVSIIWTPTNWRSRRSD
jgi:hypothetical protein